MLCPVNIVKRVCMPIPITLEGVVLCLISNYNYLWSHTIQLLLNFSCLFFYFFYLYLKSKITSVINAHASSWLTVKLLQLRATNQYTACWSGHEQKERCTPTIKHGLKKHTFLYQSLKEKSITGTFWKPVIVFKFTVCLPLFHSITTIKLMGNYQKQIGHFLYVSCQTFNLTAHHASDRLQAASILPGNSAKVVHKRSL